LFVTQLLQESVVELTSRQINKLTNQLKLKQAELELQLEGSRQSTEPVTLDQQVVGRVSRMDAIQQQQMAIANREQSTLLLKLVSTALLRIKSGEYGYCLQCGEPIAFARLNAQPFTPNCLDCQSAMERK
jgi:DnaK suppressor protein